MCAKRSKVALVLAGGGLTGAVYEIGALRAIDDLLVDRTVNDFDIYVGTSAGALVAAALANGPSPETVLRAIEGSHHRNQDSVPFVGLDGGHLSDRGAQFIASQMVRILPHAGLHYHVKQLRRQHPEVDIILIGPPPDDYQMFFCHIMRYSVRLTVARHGFESVTLDLAEDYVQYKEILAGHGIPLSRRLVITELAEIQQSGYDAEVIRRVPEAQADGCNRQRRGTPLCRLTRTLAELELNLNSIAADGS